MDAFLKFFYELISTILYGFREFFVGLWRGLVTLLNVPHFIQVLRAYSDSFTWLDWVFALISLIIITAIYILTGVLLYVIIRKYFRFRKTLVNKEDLLEELAALNRQVLKLTSEKDKIMAMKVSQIGLKSDVFDNQVIKESNDFEQKQLPSGENVAVESDASRFFKLSGVDYDYNEYIPESYDNDLNLSEMCERFRNFACSRMDLYYDIKIIRLFFAGLGSTKLIVLQGISGTGKTSLPYAFGKFIRNDATMVSVQPSWRDRTELFGYFNEFTKKFNETDVLKTIYEASYTNDVNIIILDEMNIARIEYYFAEMLSILEMPNPDEWEIELVPNSWPTDPKKLKDGKLKINKNVWYVGTANNDDSTFSISDKVYDRALPISIDTKGEKFYCEDTEPLRIGFDHLENLFTEAITKYPVSQENIEKIAKLDVYVIEKLRVAFGNRILKQLRDFVPIYVACGGTELEGIDYVLANKIFRKFESLNLAYIRDEMDALINFINKTFGRENMSESKAYIERLKKLF